MSRLTDLEAALAAWLAAEVKYVPMATIEVADLAQLVAVAPAADELIVGDSEVTCPEGCPACDIRRALAPLVNEES